jgi:hypothetical protein
MNNWCICWFFTHIFNGIWIFKGLTARRLYKSFGIKGLSDEMITKTGSCEASRWEVLGDVDPCYARSLWMLAVSINYMHRGACWMWVNSNYVQITRSLNNNAVQCCINMRGCFLWEYGCGFSPQGYGKCFWSAELCTHHLSRQQHTIYVQRNTDARLPNHCCSVKSISITYSGCVCVCVCVCTFSHPACNAHAPYCICCSALRYFFHIIS